MGWVEQYVQTLRERASVALALAQGEERLKELEAQIAQENDYRSLGKNDTERRHAFTVLLAEAPEYQRVKQEVWQLRERLSEFDVRLEELKALRRAEEWAIRARLADALAAIAGRNVSDTTVDDVAMDVGAVRAADSQWPTAF